MVSTVGLDSQASAEIDLPESWTDCKLVALNPGCTLEPTGTSQAELRPAEFEFLVEGFIIFNSLTEI